MPPTRELVMILCSSASAAWTSSTAAVGCRSETMCPLADRSLRGRYGVQPSGATRCTRLSASRSACSRIELQPDSGEQLDGSEQPRGGAVRHRGQLESPGVRGEREFLRREVERCGTALPADERGNAGCQVLGHRKQRDAAGGGQPLVPAAHQRVGSPGAHGDRDGTSHLSDINDDPGSGASSTRHEGRDIDTGTGRELNRADAHDGCSLTDGVDDRLREVLGRNVGNPADAHARTLMGGQPWVGHAREVARHQDHLTVRAGQQRGELTQALTRSAHHRDRRHRRTEQLGCSRSQRVENLGLGLVRQAEIAVLGDIGQEPDARLQRDPRYQAEGGLVQVRAVGETGILPTVDQGIHVVLSPPPRWH